MKTNQTKTSQQNWDGEAITNITEPEMGYKWSFTWKSWQNVFLVCTFEIYLKRLQTFKVPCCTAPWCGRSIHSICFHKTYPDVCLMARMGASWNRSEINFVTNKKPNTLFLSSVPIVSLFALLDLWLQEGNPKGEVLMKWPKLIPLPWHSSSRDIKKK